MGNSKTTIPLIRIHPNDNIAVLPRSVSEKAFLQHEDLVFQTNGAFVLGHKFALSPIAANEKIIKYGIPIGSATRDIAIGEHVHTHNIQSDYLPTFTLNDGSKFKK